MDWGSIISWEEAIFASLADLAIVGAAIAGLLAVVDLMMSDAQRARLSLIAVRYWSFLDELYLRLLKVRLDRGLPQLILAIVSLAVGIGFTYFPFMRENYMGEQHPYLTVRMLVWSLFLTGLVLFGVVHWLVPSVFRWLGKSQSQLGYLGRMTLIFLAYFMLIVCFGFGAQGALNAYLWAFPAASIGGMFAVLQVTAGVLTAIYGTFGVMLQLMFILLVLLYLSRALRFLEFLMRRIAESPKGPILAISAPIGGIASIVKLVH